MFVHLHEHDPCKKTICRLENRLARAFPGRWFYRGFASMSKPPCLQISASSTSHKKALAAPAFSAPITSQQASHPGSFTQLETTYKSSWTQFHINLTQHDEHRRKDWPAHRLRRRRRRRFNGCYKGETRKRKCPDYYHCTLIYWQMRGSIAASRASIEFWTLAYEAVCFAGTRPFRFLFQLWLAVLHLWQSRFAR